MKNSNIENVQPADSIYGLLAALEDNDIDTVNSMISAGADIDRALGYVLENMNNTSEVGGESLGYFMKPEMLSALYKAGAVFKSENIFIKSNDTSSLVNNFPEMLKIIEQYKDQNEDQNFVKTYLDKTLSALTDNFEKRMIDSKDISETDLLKVARRLQGDVDYLTSKGADASPIAFMLLRRGSSEYVTSIMEKYGISPDAIDPKTGKTLAELLAKKQAEEAEAKAEAGRNRGTGLNGNFNNNSAPINQAILDEKIKTLRDETKIDWKQTTKDGSISTTLSSAEWFKLEEKLQENHLFDYTAQTIGNQTTINITAKSLEQADTSRMKDILGEETPQQYALSTTPGGALPRPK